METVLVEISDQVLPDVELLLADRLQPQLPQEVFVERFSGRVSTPSMNFLLASSRLPPS